jgi:hypothetical protein
MGNPPTPPPQKKMAGPIWLKIELKAAKVDVSDLSVAFH